MTLVRVDSEADRYPTMNGRENSIRYSQRKLRCFDTQFYTTLSTTGFPSTGKFYAEFRINGTASGYPFVGIGELTWVSIATQTQTLVHFTLKADVQLAVSLSVTQQLLAGDIVGVADTSNGQVWL